jgi:hypothetical protein
MPCERRCKYGRKTRVSHRRIGRHPRSRSRPNTHVATSQPSLRVRRLRRRQSRTASAIPRRQRESGGAALYEKIAHELSHALDAALAIHYTAEPNVVTGMPPREEAAISFENAVRNQSGLEGKRISWDVHKEIK